MPLRRDGKEQNQDENENVEERSKEEESIEREEHEDVYGKMLGKEVKHCIHRTTDYGLIYIRQGILTLDTTEQRNLSGQNTFPVVPEPAQLPLTDGMILGPNMN